MLKPKSDASAALLAACVAGLLCLSPAAATAAGADTDTSGASASSAALAGGNALQEVTVLGQRTTPEIAREAQQQAPNLINLTTAEEMQKLPDVNTGEAIRRVPGISLETDTGEGRYINIRGLDADLNSTTFGGLRLPPTNNSSPDITPKTVPADGKPFAEVKLGSGEEALRHTSIIDLAGTAGGRFGGSGDYQPFSLLITASTYDDRRGIDDAEAAFVDNQAAGICR
jgi:hypothetical protein